ncbi:ABC transporter ATP-binding protein [Anoxybacterium hadale]|uniref:ABC transporter ATP-binding protein n=1 Tax=Anoxybacterium hadale TaxID=3408580 RepID=A0ACD1ADA6_9FIRM|nr:ABC transporter ATP-binding protein [Clostridiales bacterium]
MSNILELIHVKTEFEVDSGKKLKAVNDVSFKIKKGECFAVVGESGCGKSTIAKLVTHIEKVTDGQIVFDGKDITDIKKGELKRYRRNVQMIFQHPSEVFSPRMKIGAFLMEPWINFEKKAKQEAREEAYHALDRVKLPKESFNKYPHEFSGGELQRVSIARAIALHPKLLICDEATSALDVSIQKDIIDLLKQQQTEYGFAILFICHDLALVEDFCDTVAVMYLGKIVEVMHSNCLRDALHPYSKALLASVFSVHDSRDKKINILHGEPPSPIDLPEGCSFCARCKYNMELCKTEQPLLQEVNPGHYVACHRLHNRYTIGSSDSSPLD